MLRVFLATIAAIGLFGASAFAADMPTKAPPSNTHIAAPPYNWSGFYAGANFGGGWTSGNLNIPGNNFYGGISELIGGRPAIMFRLVIFYLVLKAILIGQVLIIRPFRLRH